MIIFQDKQSTKGIQMKQVMNYNKNKGLLYDQENRPHDPMSSPNKVEINPYLPSSAFKAIRDNNPNGKYIKREP